VRNFWLSAALCAVTGCVLEPLPMTAEAPPPAPAAVVAVATPAPLPPPPNAVTVMFPNLPDFLALAIPPIPLPPGRLTLSNYSFDRARVQALVTAYPDCGAHEGIVITDFALPLNGTRVIEAAPGADICWRREFPPGTAPGWTEWNRDYTGTGRSIDAKL
jgi:hypothetical protein